MSEIGSKFDDGKKLIEQYFKKPVDQRSKNGTVDNANDKSG